MTQRRHYDVAVVGAGVFGSWTAYHLRHRGKSVALLDAYGPGHSRSSSGDETRIMRMGYGPDELYTRFAQASLEMWREFIRRTGAPLFVPCGMLWLARKQDRYPVESIETLRRWRVPCEQWSRAQIQRRFPQFSLRDVDWGLFEPEAGVLMARRAVQAVVEESTQDGVEYIAEAVQPPRSTSPLKALVTNTGRVITADVFVFACGAWLPLVFPETVGKRMFPTRQEVFYFGVPRGDASFSSARMPAWYSYADNIYGLPDIEHRGTKIGFDAHGPRYDPEKGDRVVNRERLDTMRRRLGKYFPDLRRAPLAESRVCVYENTSNGDFLIDRHPRIANLWLVGGGSGHGFKHGPAVGDYVAAMIEGKIRPELRFSYASKATMQARRVY